MRLEGSETGRGGGWGGRRGVVGGGEGVSGLGEGFFVCGRMDGWNGWMGLVHVACRVRSEISIAWSGGTCDACFIECRCYVICA